MPSCTPVPTSTSLPLERAPAPFAQRRRQAQSRVAAPPAPTRTAPGAVDARGCRPPPHPGAARRVEDHARPPVASGCGSVGALATSWGVTDRTTTEKSAVVPPGGPSGQDAAAASRAVAPRALATGALRRASGASTAPGAGAVSPPSGPARRVPPSSPRPASFSPASSTRTWSPRSQRNCWCPGLPTGAASGWPSDGGGMRLSQRLARRRAAHRRAARRSWRGTAARHSVSTAEHRPGPGRRAPGTPAAGLRAGLPLVAGDDRQGVLLLGRAGQLMMTDAWRGGARTWRGGSRSQWSPPASTPGRPPSAGPSSADSCPNSLATIPGVDTAIVYEPHGEGQTVGGDFYDLFPMGTAAGASCSGTCRARTRRRCRSPASPVTWCSLLAREGHGVESVLGG